MICIEMRSPYILYVHRKEREKKSPLWSLRLARRGREAVGRRGREAVGSRRRPVSSSRGLDRHGSVQAVSHSAPIPSRRTPRHRWRSTEVRFQGLVYIHKFTPKFHYAKRRFSITSKYRHIYGVLNVDEIKN
jgi:hypothetical protein